MLAHLIGCPFERHAGGQAREAVRSCPRPGSGAELLQRLPVWNQELGLLTDDREAWRHHADHRPALACGGERHAQHVRAAAKPALPEFVTQHDDRVATEILLGRVGTAQRGLHLERAKDVGREG